MATAARVRIELRIEGRPSNANASTVQAAAVALREAALAAGMELRGTGIDVVLGDA